MRNVLVLFSEIPEAVYMVLLQDVSPDDFELLVTFNDVYINGGDSDEAMEAQINEFFFDKDGNFLFEEQTIEGGKIDVSVNAVIYTGIIQ